MIVSKKTINSSNSNKLELYYFTYKEKIMNVNNLLILGLVSFIFNNYNINACEDYNNSISIFNEDFVETINNTLNNNQDLDNNDKSFISNIIDQTNKYQQIRNDGINTILQYLLPILQVFVSTNNNKSQNDLQKAIDYINVMSGLT